MTKQLILSTILLCLAQFCLAQSGITGVWKTIDDASGEAKSHVTIEEKDGQYYGKLTEILTKNKNAVCSKCDGERKNQPIMGMMLLENLKPYKDYYSYGTIVDPNSGKEYKCSIWMDNDDTLTVRGYVGISALGRSQKWYRVNK